MVEPGAPRTRSRRGTGRGVYFDKERQCWAYKRVLHGEIIKARGFANAHLAGEACRAAVHAAEQRHLLAAAGPSFEEASRQFIQARGAHLAPATAEKYEDAFRRMSEHGWRALPLPTLTKSHVLDYLKWRQQHGGHAERPILIKGATLNRDLAALSALLVWWQLPNVCRDVERYDEPWRPYLTVTDAELAVILDVMRGQDKHQQEPIKCELLAVLGVRLRVVLCLKWEQVDFANSTLQYRSKGKDIVRYLPPRAVELLKSLDPRPVGWVFSTRCATTFRRRWHKARVLLGKPALRPHDLRVTFARKMASRGVDPFTISDMLGHSTLTMTARYIPRSLSAQRAAYATVPTPVPTI